eukprot:403333304
MDQQAASQQINLRSSGALSPTENTSSNSFHNKFEKTHLGQSFMNLNIPSQETPSHSTNINHGQRELQSPLKPLQIGVNSSNNLQKNYQQLISKLERSKLPSADLDIPLKRNSFNNTSQINSSSNKSSLQQENTNQLFNFTQTRGDNVRQLDLQSNRFFAAQESHQNYNLSNPSQHVNQIEKSSEGNQKVDQKQLESIYDRITKLRQSLVEQDQKSKDQQSSAIQQSQIRDYSDMIQSTSHFGYDSNYGVNSIGKQLQDYNNLRLKDYQFSDNKENSMRFNSTDPNNKLIQQFEAQQVQDLMRSSQQNHRVGNTPSQNYNKLEYSPLRQKQDTFHIQNNQDNRKKLPIQHLPESYKEIQRLSQIYDPKQHINDHLPNLQETLKEHEKLIQETVEQKYSQKLQDLEKRSVYLDRSLDLIEEMKQKFKVYENQQSMYIDLLSKYNDLQSQVSNQRESLIPQSNITFQHEKEEGEGDSDLEIYNSGNFQLNQDSTTELDKMGGVKQSQNFNRGNNGIIQQNANNTNIQSELQIFQVGSITNSSALNTHQHQDSQSLEHQNFLPNYQSQSYEIIHAPNTQTNKNKFRKNQNLKNIKQQLISHNYTACNGYNKSLNNPSFISNLQMENTGKNTNKSRSITPQNNSTRRNNSYSKSPLSSKLLQIQSCSLRNRNNRLSLGLPIDSNSHSNHILKKKPVKQVNKTYGVIKNNYSSIGSQSQQNQRRQSSITSKSQNQEKNQSYYYQQPNVPQIIDENQAINADIQNAFHSEVVSNLNGQITKLKKQKRMMKTQMKSLKHKIDELQDQMPPDGGCCCKDMQSYYETKLAQCDQISDHWKHKTQQLVQKHYKSIQLLREQQEALKTQSSVNLEQLRIFQDQAVHEIIKKQVEVQVYYEKRLKNYERENKQLKKRLIQTRNSISQK